MDTFRRRTLANLLAVSLCAACAVSCLADPGESQALTVTFGDLDLRTHDGVATLYTRLEAAATSVCNTRTGTSSHAEIDSCIDSSVRLAVSRIGAPRLIALYQTRSGHALLHLRP